MVVFLAAVLCYCVISHSLYGASATAVVVLVIWGSRNGHNDIYGLGISCMAAHSGLGDSENVMSRRRPE